MVNYSTMLTSLIVFIISGLLGFAPGMFIAVIVFIASLIQVSPVRQYETITTVSYECKNCSKRFKSASNCKRHEGKCKNDN